MKIPFLTGMMALFAAGDIVAPRRGEPEAEDRPAGKVIRQDARGSILRILNGVPNKPTRPSRAEVAASNEASIARAKAKRARKAAKLMRDALK